MRLRGTVSALRLLDRYTRGGRGRRQPLFRMGLPGKLLSVVRIIEGHPPRPRLFRGTVAGPIYRAVRMGERFTRPALTPARFRAAADDIPRQVAEAQDDLIRGALNRARGLSTGRYSSAQLAQMGHPYRHAGHPPMDPSVINRQTGAFARSWRAQAGNKGIENTAPEAAYLFAGTSRMIRRPILDRVYAWLAQVAPQRFAAGIAQAFKGKS